MLSIDDFKKVEITLGTVMLVERVPDTDKLLRLEVDFGPKLRVEEADVPRDEAAAEPQETQELRDIRQVVSGIAGYLTDPQVLVGRTVPFVTNLEPRTIRGLQSQAMILAASTDEGEFSILETTLKKLPAGTTLG